jgi:hypothetical protein
MSSGEYVTSFLTRGRSELLNPRISKQWFMIVGNVDRAGKRTEDIDWGRVFGPLG